MSVVFFDIDDTLITTSHASKASLVHVFRQVLQIDLSTVQFALAGRTDAGIIAELASHFNIPLDDRMRSIVLDAYLDRLKVQIIETPGIQLPGALQLIKKLNLETKTNIGVITGNCKRGAAVKLTHHGLAEFIQFGGYGDIHLERNSVARVALESASAFVGREVRGEEVWVIGDTPLDVTCAKSIGANSIAVATGGFTLEQLQSEKPTFAVPDLTYVFALLSEHLPS